MARSKTVKQAKAVEKVKVPREKHRLDGFYGRNLRKRESFA